MAEEESDSSQAPKGYVERADPDGELRQQAEMFRRVTRSPLGRGLLRLFGAPADVLDQAQQTSEAALELLKQPDRIAAFLAPLGWVYHSLAHVDRYTEAATLVEQGRPDEAESLLVETYNEDDYAFIRFYHRVVSLYRGRDEEWQRIGRERSRLLDEAYELHKEEHYAGCISIVFAQIDGIFVDMTSKPAKYFYDDRNPNLVDDETLAGHPLGLKQLAALMGEPATSTRVTDKFNRQGILHGRYLAYDTLLNSTKAWAALLAVIDAMGPRAEKIAARKDAEYERRWAGSKEVDEWGARRDQRGFDDARMLLHDVHLFQYGYRQQHGRYAAGRHALDPAGILLGKYTSELRMQVSEDSSEYWAWVRTPTAMVFGIAAGSDEFNDWWKFVADDVEPEGGAGTPGWQHILEADFPDW